MDSPRSERPAAAAALQALRESTLRSRRSYRDSVAQSQHLAAAEASRWCFQRWRRYRGDLTEYPLDLSARFASSPP